MSILPGRCAMSRLYRALSIVVILGSSLTLTACGGGGGSSQTSVTQNIDQSGGRISLSPGNGQTVNITIPANAVPQPVKITAAQLRAGDLPVPITRSAHTRGFTPNPNNVFVFAFKITVVPTTIKMFNAPLTIDAVGLVPTNVPANATLNLAFLQNEGQTNAAYNDVGTFKTGANNTLTENLPTSDLPGITQPGTYVIYVPAQGTNITLANFGIALLTDEQGGASLQVINLFDSAGKPLVTPTIKTLPFADASDLDGQAITPDGSQGILVDGGSTVRFFSNVQTGTPAASSASVDISKYGGDGDSVAILPNGDTAVVAGDSADLVVISGILSGSPKLATTIPCPAARDGVVISNDGKTLLARGGNGLTVFSITPATAAPGPLGGTLAFTFTQVMDIPGLGTTVLEDGRDGMAFSPADSSRAVVIGRDANNAPIINIITGLPNAPVTRSAALNIPPYRGSLPQRAAEKKGRPTRVVLAGFNLALSVAVTLDGKNAVVGTEAGLTLVSGVDTGNLAQVGAVFNPAFTATDPSSGASKTYQLGMVTTLGITLDGKYVVACSQLPSPDKGTLFLIPINGTAFGSAASQLNGVSVPDNDEILLH
jgi:hypothetical protein